VRPVLAATLLSAAGANLEAIIRLAQNNPPTGWRPTGTNRDDSDFDLLLILPDTVPESLTGQATGQVWQTAQTRGHAEDRRRDAVRTGRGQLAARERGQAVRGPGAIVTAPRQHGAIVSAETLDRPHLASSPASWHPMCIPCDARTPLVVTPMQAVSPGPETCPEVDPAAHSFVVAQSCLTRRLTADVGGDEEVPGGRSEPANRAV